VAGAPSLVEIGLELLAPLAVVLDFQHGSPLRTQCGRESIGQAEGDKLCKAGLIAVRQITAFVPATESQLGGFPVSR
jgi:hypothetical protein